MKKKICIIVIGIVVLLAVLFVPIPTGIYKDGGTKVYSALTYKIVNWNRMYDDGVYQKTSVYFLADRFRSIDDLWNQYEAEKAEHTFTATIVELTTDSVTVKPAEHEAITNSCDRISFGIKELDEIDVKVGSVVKVTYTGDVKETYPGQVTAVCWEIAKDLRPADFKGEWIDKDKIGKYDGDLVSDIVITEIYGDCFFGEPVIPMPYQIKFNGTLSDNWCVGDQIYVIYKNIYYDEENYKAEVDLLTVKPSDFELEPGVAYKPVIYLYPEEKTEVSVHLTLDGKLTCTYPTYESGWQVTAMPDGTLKDKNGQIYNYLYWEGETYAQYDFSKGFCVKGEDTAVFLEQSLAKLGLTRQEANEFIVYWLPLMQNNPYNIISFQTDCYTDAAKLNVQPKPDTLIRVFMAWKPSHSYVKLEEQLLSAPNRTGFTVVEWGGTLVD